MSSVLPDPHYALSGPNQDTLDGRGGYLLPGSDKNLYYRLYTREGAIATNKRIYTNDRFIGRTSLSRFITHPHTATTVKNQLCEIEGFPVGAFGTLFESLSSPNPMEESTPLSLKDYDGPGSSEDDPVALIIGADDAKKRTSPGRRFADKLYQVSPREFHYVHYHFYDKDGAIPSKMSFNPDDDSLGRIDTLSIAPLHTVVSIKARIVKAEEVTPDQKIQLFEDMMDDEVLLNDDNVISLFAQVYPGYLENEPLAIVCGGVDETDAAKPGAAPVDAERPQGTQGKSKLYPAFLKRLKAGWRKPREN